MVTPGLFIPGTGIPGARETEAIATGVLETLILPVPLVVILTTIWNVQPHILYRCLYVLP